MTSGCIHASFEKSVHLKQIQFMLYHESERKNKENANFVHIIYLHVLAKLCNIFVEAFFIDVSILTTKFYILLLTSMGNTIPSAKNTSIYNTIYTVYRYLPVRATNGITILPCIFELSVALILNNYD